MDFASLMSKEISKSGQTSPPPTSTSESTKKYLKRAEVEAQRQESYLREQTAVQHSREEKVLKKRKLEEEETSRAHARDEKRRRLAEESRLRREEEESQKERARRKRLGLPDLPPKDHQQETDSPLAEGQADDIPDADLISKLRSLSEPAILFGETHKQRLRRYNQLIAKSLAPRPTLTTGPIPTTLSLLPEADMKLTSITVPTAPSERAFLFRQLASYFTMVLTEWAVALENRPQAVKESFQGKQAYGAMEQSRENMRPLFRRFEKGELEEGILEPVVEIVKAAQERRYVDASDGYLRLSIGKA